jgi:hypothetical protein
MAKKSTNKRQSTKIVYETVHDSNGWVVKSGRLKPGRGRPAKVRPLFEVVAEKLPFSALAEVKTDMIEHGYSTEGVYLAHDSFGVARYGGRGSIFGRLASHKKKYPRELEYFSFYTIADKKHEREIETALLRAAGPTLTLNTRKVRNGIDPGSVNDYEPGTEFYERQIKRGPKKKATKANKK